MADIVHDFPINASRQRVFQAVSSPSGLDSWWSKRSSGEPNVEFDEVVPYEVRLEV